MNQRVSHGDDRFRILVALLVVAIHTSPLSSYSKTLDFILTRVIGRIAVPYFFMLTGYFFLSQFMESKETSFKICGKFLAKVVFLYLGSIALYLPMNLYAGHFKGENPVLEILRGILFEGTFYHLWFFPAMLLGIIIVYLLIQICNRKMVLIITSSLFVIGLFGDSYYGVISNIPILSLVYDRILDFFGYTRNGLFYAPIFLVLGVWIKVEKKQTSSFIHRVGFLLSLFFMLVEGLTLNAFHVQHHDSMYVFLLPCMYFLFQILISVNGKADKGIRTISMWIYIVHPLGIIAVRGLGKLTRSTELLVNNSFIHYLIVCMVSVVVAIVITALEIEIKEKKYQRGRAWLEIDRSHLRQNVATLRSMLPKSCELMPAVKADAYGHGAIEIAKELNRLGVGSFCVATVAEGIALRQKRIKGDILVLGYTDPKQMILLHKYQLIQTIVDYDYAQRLNQLGIKIRAHIKIDTGMHRLGEGSENTSRIFQIFQCKNLKIEGMYTHLSVSDDCWETDREFTCQQVTSFYAMVEALEKMGLKRPKLHIQNSYGVLNYPDISCDYARVGIALYGAVDRDLNSDDNSGFLPVLEVKARVAIVKSVPCGEVIGYGRQYTAPKNMKIAVITIGYGDGIPRSLSGGRGNVIIHGEKAAIVGRICMDQMMVDVTNIDEVRQGDEAIIIGESGKSKITACEAAEQGNTIPNEILSRLGARLERVYK